MPLDALLNHFFNHFVRSILTGAFLAVFLVNVDPPS